MSPSENRRAITMQLLAGPRSEEPYVVSVQAKREYLQAMVMRYRQASRREKQ
jgi:hypothetical protein